MQPSPIQFSLRKTRSGIASLICLLAMTVASIASAEVFTIRPAGNVGFDILADGVLIAPVRLAAGDAIQADTVTSDATSLRLSGLHAKNPAAVTFAVDDFVMVTLPTVGSTNNPTTWEPVVSFKLTLNSFDTNAWLGMFPDGRAPFHFLVCAMPTAPVWHQRGWLNATPVTDPFPLLLDSHIGSPEISCLWNRNWSYLCPLGAHPIPMVGLWDPENSLYVGYDFQDARATDQSDRYICTGYCWKQAGLTNFIALSYPYGGVRYGQQVYPKGGEVLASRFTLEVDTALPPTEDPNERFQTRLFQRYTNALPLVPAMNDLGWLPGAARLNDFTGPIGVNLYGPGGETNFYPSGTVLLQGWGGHVEMPIDTAAHRGDLATINLARSRVGSLLTNYAQVLQVGSDTCLFWKKPLSGAWRPEWGGDPATTLHDSEGWYAARVLVELYRYDRNRGQANAGDLAAIDELFNWAKHFVWSRNEFADVPSSPFAIGAALSSAFLLDYYFTFRNDPVRKANAADALHLADVLIWRYVHPFAMDSDRFDGAVDSAFMAEPNSGRDWAGLGCANEMNWTIDSMTQVYVHTGDDRLRYYLRGMLQRWPVQYQPVYQDSIAAYGSSDGLSEGYGVFDGAGPGRGGWYPYGFSLSLPLNEPIGNSTMRVVAGVGACIAFDKNGTSGDVTNYRTGGNGACTFRIVSTLPGQFDVSFSYPFVDISQLTVTRTRAGQTVTLTPSQVTRPPQSPSSLYFNQLQDGDILTIGTVPVVAPTLPANTTLVYNDTNTVRTTNGLFTTLPLHGNDLLAQDWTDLDSFAGLVTGTRWSYGVPYLQGLHSVTNPIAVPAPDASVILLTYSPSPNTVLTAAPALLLDDGSRLPMSGHPVLAWRAWPIIFDQKVLMDYAIIPAGRTVSQADPNGTQLMSATAFTGTPTDWQPTQKLLANASAAFVADETQQLALQALQQSFSTLPVSRIALLPLNTSGPGANFAASTGLRKKWDVLTEAQLIDTNWFNATRYPIAFYLGSENYVKTVLTSGDGKLAITRYLAGGGTIVLLATGPFPFYYGYGPSDQAGPADPLLPSLGVNLQGFEQAPAGVFMQRYTNQTILQSVPDQFAFPPGDQRLRAPTASLASSASRYVPLLKVVDARSVSYGDAVAYMVLGSGSAKGGKLLYLWDTLVAGPQGQQVMSDTLTWLINAILRPQAPRFDSAALIPGGRVAFQFNAAANLDYVVQSRADLTAGTWSTWRDFSSAPTNRTITFTNVSAGTKAQYYRVVVGP